MIAKARQVATVAGVQSSSSRFKGSSSSRTRAEQERSSPAFAEPPSLQHFGASRGFGKAPGLWADQSAISNLRPAPGAKSNRSIIQQQFSSYLFGCLWIFYLLTDVFLDAGQMHLFKECWFSAESRGRMRYRSILQSPWTMRSREDSVIGYGKTQKLEHRTRLRRGGHGS